MFLRNKTGVNAPPGVNGLREDDRIPVIKVVSGDSWVVDADLIAADGGPASPKNSYVEFVLSENQFSPPIWTGEWINGVLPDENIPGLVHIRIPGEITKSLRRGSYMFSVRVSDPMKFTFSTQLKGNFLVEYMPTSDHRSIPYRDGTSEIFGGTQHVDGSSSGGREGYDELVKTVEKLQIKVAQKADRTSVYSKEETDSIVQEGVSQAVADVVDGAPTALDTLKEIAEWIGNDHSGATQAIADKVDKVDGMGLSHNDFTDADKEKVDNLKAVATSGSYLDLSNTPTIPTVPGAYTSTPAMDGVGAAGSSTEWAKGDHVHPTDTSRAPLASPALTGTPTAPDPGDPTHTSQVATVAYVDGKSRYSFVSAQQTGGWQFSGGPEGWIVEESSMAYSGGNWTVSVSDGSEDPTYYNFEGSGSESATDVSLSAVHGEGIITITAKRAWALQDRARNYVSLTSDGTLQLPPAVPGKMRDLVVRMVLTATSNVVPSPSFDDSVDYEAEGGVFPDFSEEGTYIVRLTETDQTVVGGEVTGAVFFIQSSLVELVSAGGAP